MEGVTPKREVVELQYWVQRLRKIHAHPMSGLSVLHHVSSKRYALHRLVHLVEGVTPKREVVELQYWVQRLRKIHAHPMSGLSELHNVSSKRYALH